MYPAVSVIIPTYNRLWSLPGVIESVRCQTVSDFEIIIVDDGSADGTEQWVREHAPDARYIYIDNVGVSRARNVGIKNSRGRYIAFLDSDDFFYPQKLKRQLEAMEGGAVASYTDEVWIRNGRRVNPRQKHKKQGGDLFFASLPLVIISPSSVMLRREIFDEVGYFDETMHACEDYDFFLRLTARHRVSFIPELLIVKTGGHPDQLSKKYWGLDMLRISSLERLLTSGHLNEQQEKAVIDHIVQKSRIVAGGAQKRENDALASTYRDKVAYYGGILSDGR